MPEYVPYPPQRIIVPDIVTPPSPDAIARVAFLLLSLRKAHTSFPEPMRHWHDKEETLRVRGTLRRLVAQALSAADPHSEQKPFSTARSIAERCVPADTDVPTPLSEIARILEDAEVPFIGQAIREVAEKTSEMMTRETEANVSH